ncbi:MAG: hypothetical protein LAN84_14840 [Acidobacteriia bacterium]|nr:hypothetical protein [Terriglobia bacterium]
MSVQTWIAIVGNCGAVCTTGAFVPQVWKIWKQGGRDLSYSMLGIYLLGVLLWLVYGLLLRAEAVILANAATTVLVLASLILKRRAEKSVPAVGGVQARVSVS